MNRRKKWGLSVLAGILLMTSVVWILGRRSPENGQMRMIYIPKTQDGSNDFWTSLLSGAKQAATEYNVDLTIMAPEREQDVEQQESILQEAIAMKPDVLLLTPSSPSLNPYMDAVDTKTTKVVYIDSKTDDDRQDVLISTDNLNAGRMLGEYAASILPEDGKIAIVSHVQGVSTANEREEGFREGLGDKADHIVELVYCNSEYDKAYQLTLELLEKYPDLAMVAGMNEYSSLGAARAVKDAALGGVVSVIGVDTSMEAVQLMENGVFQAFVVQKAFKMGYLGIQNAVDLLQGRKVPAFVDSGCELVTLENLYDSDIEQLIFSFDS